MKNLLTPRFWAWTFLASVMALGTPACDDDSGTTNNTNNVDPCAGRDVCSTVDEVGCLDNMTQICAEDADGCMVWTDVAECDIGQICEAGACVCDDECGLTDSRCDGAWVQECFEDTNGCLFWDAVQNCAETSQTCDDTADAMCVGGDECGDGTITGAEVCDTDNLDGETCSSQGFFAGTLACAGDCSSFDTSGCTDSCGDDTINGTDVCDGSDLGGEDCTDYGFSGGTLACLADCTDVDTTGCTDSCGDDVINGTDVCDGIDLNGEDCTDYGFFGGTLACAADCSAVDTSLCTYSCGDDVINGTDTCDGTDLGGETCISQGFFGGTLACNVTCDGFDVSGCVGSCGDNTTNGTDVCDGSDLNGEDCASQGYYGGTLTCAADCSGYDTSSCSGTCGDTIINGTEECEAGDLNGQDCITLGFGGGTLGCTGCMFDTTGCTAPMGSTCADAYDVSSSGMPLTVTGSFDEDPVDGFSCDTTPNNVVWFSFTAPNTALYGFNLANATTTLAYSRLAILDGTACAPYDAELSCTMASAKTVSAEHLLTAGDTVLIAFYTDGDEYTMVDPTIDITETIVATGAGATCTTPTDVTTEAFPYAEPGLFDEDPVDGFSCDTTPTNVVWFSFTAPNNAVYNFDLTNNTSGSAYSRLAIMDGTTCAPYGAEYSCTTSTSKTLNADQYLNAGDTVLIAFFTDDDASLMVDPEIDITETLVADGDMCMMPLDLDTLGLPLDTLGTFDIDPADGFSCDTTPTNMVWYSFTPADTGRYDISLVNNTTTVAYSRVVVLDGTSCSPYNTELTCETANAKTINTSVDLEGGLTYLIGFFTDGNAYTMVDPQIDIVQNIPTIDWCILQFPQDITDEEGQHVTVYGRFYSAGLTDTTSDAIDYHPGVIAQAGYAPVGTDPVTNPDLFTWGNATPNVGVGNDDEYMSTVVVPPAGLSYDMAYRFSGDGGATWTYCDREDSVYDNPGLMTPAVSTVLMPPMVPGDLVITEVMQNPNTLTDGAGEWFEVYNTQGVDMNLIGCTIFDLGTNSHTITGNFIVPAFGYATASNGFAPGFTPSYVYGSDIAQGNGDDEIYIDCDGIIIDGVEWDGGPIWPDPTGDSMSLDPAALDETLNDDGANWCNGVDWYNGDYGTPNAPNPSCI